MAAATAVSMADWTAGCWDCPSAATSVETTAVPSVVPMVGPLVASMDDSKAALSELMTAAHSVGTMAALTAA